MLAMVRVGLTPTCGSAADAPISRVNGQFVPIKPHALGLQLSDLALRKLQVGEPVSVGV
jgi:hypothetical protein